MNKTMKLLVALACTAAVAAFVSPVAARAGYTLEWQSIDGGGDLRGSGGNYELSGTVGQPDAGRLTGGTYALNGGFWFQQPPGDCNADGLVNLLDQADFVPCFDGPVLDWTDPTCRCFDFDRDDDIDLRDFSAFAQRFAN